MKNKIKKIAVCLLSILLIILIGFSFYSNAAINENTSSKANTTNDANKNAAVLNDSYVLPYIARDMATYNNLYCVCHSKGFDSNLVDKTNIRLVATAMVEIVGNNAKFYDINTDEKDNSEVNYLGETNTTENNIMAGIVSDETIPSAKGYTIYKGYGASIIKRSTYPRYEPDYTITQVAIHKYYNTWRKTIPEDINPGFLADSVDWSNISDAKEKAADEYITKIKASTETYSARIYFLRVKYGASSEWRPYQNTILVEPIKKLTIPVEKKWEDESIDTSNRTEITVKLLADGVDTGKTLKLNSGNNWKGQFTELEKADKDGKEIVYTIKEVSVTGYDSVIKGEQATGFTITNTLQTTSVSVTKSWDDYGTARPTSVTVALYENGKITTKTAVLNAANEWKYTFTNLPKYKSGKLVNYTVKETNLPENYTSSITGNAETGYTIVNEGEPHGYVEITGKVWNDAIDGKTNAPNGKLEGTEKGISGIKVVLKDAQGNPIQSIYTDENGKFTRTDYALTKADGTYTIRVNYDNSKSVYKLYENAETVATKLKTAYVEFEYDAAIYTTVATATTGANTSKAKENQTDRNTFDVKYGTITPTTDVNILKNEKITAITKNVISFESYADKTQKTESVVVKYCKGDGTHIRTNAGGEWLEPSIEKNTTEKHSCQGKAHNLKTQEIDKEIIQNVNLGLFEREQPDVAIFSDISKVKVTMRGQEYTYLYGVRSNEKNNVGLKAKFQEKDTYIYKRPVNPADIAYIKETNSNAMSVEVTYDITLANLSTTVPVTIHNIDNYYDSRYTLITNGWKQEQKTDFKVAQYNGDLNITLQPGTESEKIQLTYTVNLEAIKELLNEKAPLNNAVEIQSYSTKYGEKTVYAEQRTGGRTGTLYGGYDRDSHPGNANIALKAGDDGITRLYSTDSNGNIIPINKVEDDTDLAPSFQLCMDPSANIVLSGNVWEDSDADPNDGLRLGDGKKSDSEKNVENVKVSLHKVNDDGTIKEEPAQLYSINKETAESETEDAVRYTNSDGYYSFGDEIWSVEPGRYVIKFTYGGKEISARDYKSTIISADSKLYPIFKGTSSDENWYLDMSKGYSIAVDDIEARAKIEDLQYNNFENSISITASSKPFILQIDAGAGEEIQVGADGKTETHNKIDVFDFGIVERAREDIFVETTVENIKITLANGQGLVDGNPKDKLNYTKAMGLNQNIDKGEDARNALEKQVLVEIDAELLQGAQLEVKYGLKVTNKSEKDFDTDDYYYYGEYNDHDPIVSSSVNYVIDYLDGEFKEEGINYKWENPEDWTLKTADELLNGGLISQATYDAIKGNRYTAFITEKFNNLVPGEDDVDYLTVKKILSNQAENVYDNHAEILKIDTKTAKTIKETGTTKEYKMGNYVPGLEDRKTYEIGEQGNEKAVYVPEGLEKAGLHEQDDDRVKIVITPPTGTTKYITTYVITGVIGLIVIGAVIIFIKKKVLTK